VIDFTPPTIELDGADSGKAVKNDVAVIADDYDYLYLADAKGNKIRNVSNGEVFSAAGVYYIIAADYAGNSAAVTFSIDISVDYTLSVPNGAVTIEPVTLDTAEPLAVDVKLNGELIDAATRFAAPGEYELTLTDELGNSILCVFTILPTRMQYVSQRLPNGTRIVAVTKDGTSVAVTDSAVLDFTDTGVYTVTLDCGGVQYELMLEVDNTPPVVNLTKDGSAVKIAAVDKENVTFKLTQDGKEKSCRVGTTLDDPGDYVLIVTDELGNSAVYKFSIPYRLNTWAIIAIVIGAIVLVVVLILIIRARRKPRMK
ncbi:MAG: hypothetical protein K2O39_08280, partial [Clostridiales bacterium]|nr:hypothetical protein [Clostridiales bacterium]